MSGLERRRRSPRHAAALLLTLSGAMLGVASSAASGQVPAPAADSLADSAYTPSPLYAASEPLALTFTVNIGQLKHDRDDKAPWRTASMSYVDGTGRTVSIPVRAKTHGIWRLKHCDFPPVRLDFSGKFTKGTVFAHVHRPKLVNYCRDSDQYEQLVLSEFQLYRIYQLLTPISHQVRLLRMTYRDSASGRTHAVRYAFLLEDPEQMAARLGGQLVRQKGAGPNDLEAAPGAMATLFQYMVGGTDFAFSALHNTEIVQRLDGSYLPIVYDFDFTGAVNAPYATPDPQLHTTTVRERVFRGYCAHRGELPAAAQRVQERREAIYALYRDDIGKLMDPRAVRSTLAYYDDFYDAIATPQRAERDVFSHCLGR